MRISKLSISLLLALIATNGYWAIKWLDSSIEVKSVDASLYQCGLQNDSHIELIQMLASDKSRESLESIFNASDKDFWVQGNSLNTDNLKFSFKSLVLESVSKQKEINPNDKG